ncbi:MAG: hypothetical protein JST30_10150 [Armatimonadetes bacterium]|nr:hypothetical protein [Armatimonadota bacterium]
MLVLSFLPLAPELEVRTDTVAVAVDTASKPVSVAFRVKGPDGRWATVLYSSDKHNRPSAFKAQRIGNDRIAVDFTSPVGTWRRVYRVTGDRIAVDTKVSRLKGPSPTDSIYDGYSDTRGATLDGPLQTLADSYGPMPRFATLGSAFIGLPADDGQITDSCGTMTGGGFAGFGLKARTTIVDGRPTLGRLVAPSVCSWSYVVFPDTDDYAAMARANTWSWTNFGHKRMSTALPQCMPFSGYTKNAYALKPSGEEEESEPAEGEGPWWDAELSGREVGAPRQPGFVSWDARGNAAKAAWGMYWWGQTLKIKTWQERGREYFALTMAAPMKNGRLPSRFDLSRKTWDYERVLPVQEATTSTTMTTLRWIRAWLDRWPDDADERTARSLAAEFFRHRTSTGDHDPTVLAFAEEVQATATWGEDVHAQAKKVTDASESGGSRFDLSSWPGSNLGDSVRRASGRTSKADLAALVRAVDTAAFGQSVLDDPRLDVPTFGTLALAGMSGRTSDVGDTALDLMRAGAMLDRQDVFERGVALLRSLFSRTTDPTHTLNGLGPLDGDNLGRTGENLNLGTGEAVGRRSFETGEGSFLADCARALDEFGGLYVHSSGWAVGVDGCVPGRDDGPVSILTLNPRPYAGPHQVDAVSGSQRRSTEARRNPGIADLRIEAKEGRLVVVATPAVLAPDQRSADPAGTFSSGAWRAKATISSLGFEALLPVDARTKRTIAFQGRVSGTAVAKSKTFRFDPPATLTSGWDFATTGVRPIVPSLTTDGSAMVSTGDDGQGHEVPLRLGSVKSFDFVATGGKVSFVVRADVKTGVRLIDATSGNALHEIKGPASAKVEWALGTYLGKTLRIELEDRSGNGSASLSHYAFRR